MEKTVKKVFLYLIGSIVYLYGTFWVFNHVNPWLSWVMILLFIYFVIIKGMKFLK